MSSDNGFYSDMPDGNNDNIANSNEDAGASGNNDYQRDNNNYSSSSGAAAGGGNERGNRRGYERPSEQGISVLVRNLDNRARKEDVQDFFAKYGEVLDVYLPKNYHTGRPTGFGFVSMKTMEDAEKAIQEANNQTLMGRQVTCELAKEKRKSKDEMAQKSGPSRGGGGGDRRGGDRRESRRRSRDRRRSRSRDRRDSRKGGRGRSGDRERTRRARSGDRDKRGGSDSRATKKERSRSPPPRRGETSDKMRDT